MLEVVLRQFPRQRLNRHLPAIRVLRTRLPVSVVEPPQEVRHLLPKLAQFREQVPEIRGAIVPLGRQQIDILGPEAVRACPP